MHARAPIPVYILDRFYSYMNIHYTPTLQNIHYTTYIPTLVLAGWLASERAINFQSTVNRRNAFYWVRAAQPTGWEYT